MEEHSDCYLLRPKAVDLCGGPKIISRLHKLIVFICCVKQHVVCEIKLVTEIYFTNLIVTLL